MMRTIALLLTFILTAPVLASPESRIIAVINKGVITQKDLDNRMRWALISSGMEDNSTNRKNLRQQILHAMIDEMLQLQAFKEAKVEISDEEVDEAIAAMEESSGSPTGTARAMLSQNHIPEQTLTEQARAQLGWVEMIRKEYMPMIQVSDGEVDQEFKKLKEAEQKVQYHLAEIVIPIDDQISEAKALQDAENLRRDIKKGANFSAVAQQFSHSATAAQGGDLGWLTQDQLPPEIRDTIHTIKMHDMSAPTRTSGGYTLYLLRGLQRPGESIDTKISILQAEIPYPTLPTDYEIEETLQKLVQLSQASKSCQDLTNRIRQVKGGSIQESGKLSYSQLNRELLDLIQGLEKNQKTKVHPSESAAVVFMICDKQDIKPEEWTRDAVTHILTQRKLRLLGRRELRDLKRHAFIDIRQ